MEKTKRKKNIRKISVDGKRSKAFDAVKMMRAIRDKISVETKSMSYEEFIQYISEKLKSE